MPADKKVGREANEEPIFIEAPLDRWVEWDEWNEVIEALNGVTKAAFRTSTPTKWLRYLSGVQERLAESWEAHYARSIT